MGELIKITFQPLKKLIILVFSRQTFLKGKQKVKYFTQQRCQTKQLFLDARV